MVVITGAACILPGCNPFGGESLTPEQLQAQQHREFTFFLHQWELAKALKDTGANFGQEIGQDGPWLSLYGDSLSTIIRQEDGNYHILTTLTLHNKANQSSPAAYLTSVPSEAKYIYYDTHTAMPTAYETADGTSTKLEPTPLTQLYYTRTYRDPTQNYAGPITHSITDSNSNQLHRTTELESRGITFQEITITGIGTDGTHHTIVNSNNQQ